MQIVPHITDEIKAKVYAAANTSGADIVITEVGGTIGDIESQSFIEALRQLGDELGKENTLFVHCTLVPFIYGSNELKTKPTQHSVIELRGMGIQPDFIVTRSPEELNDHLKEKIALYCSIPKEHVIDSVDVKNIFQVPLNYHKQGMDELVLKQFKLDVKPSNIKYWEDLVEKVDNLKDEIEISLVGKYVELHDAYLSVAESLKHAGYANNVRIRINWVNSEELEKLDDLSEVFKNTSGIIVPGGFGSRGIEGKINAIKYARENKIPFLGICLGMQLAVIEFARNVCGLPEASSTEFDELCKDPIIDLMAEQKGIINKGGTLRLGNYDCKLVKGTLAYDDYKQDEIQERHRHRYEFNNKYKELLAEHGMVFSGINEKADLVEIIELKDHPHFIACQFHPEFKSRPTRPHPLFNSFIRESVNNKK